MIPASNNPDNQSLLDVLKNITGTNYSSLSEAVFFNRSHFLRKQNQLHHLNDLIGALQKGEITHYNVARTYSTGIYDFFRDPFYYRTLRNSVLPEFKEQSSLNAWVPFSRNGAEALSLSILLFEERRNKPGDRVSATDSSSALVHHSSAFSLETETIQVLNTGFQKSGGKVNFVDFIYETDGLIHFHDLIQKKINFQIVQNIMDFASSRSFELIQCRNTLLDRTDVEKYTVYQALSSSLRPGGFLAVGFEEVDFLNKQQSFGLHPFSLEYGVFRKN